jgi:Fic family protein
MAMAVIEYYDRMSEVRRNGNYEQWLKFFLQAVYESAEDAVLTIDKLSVLHNENSKKIGTVGKTAPLLSQLLTYLEENPIIDIAKTSNAMGLTFNTVNSAIKRLCGLDILQQTAGNQRYKTFSYSAYLGLLREGT